MSRRCWQAPGEDRCAPGAFKWKTGPPGPQAVDHEAPPGHGFLCCSSFCPQAAPQIAHMPYVHGSVWRLSL